ncbi:hypothetical protein MGALJ_45540 [Mycobacterium gallinarum]|uniref:Uncharacterized protein n=1 Tax=Mycobacterium gallinarum TaxID=39689 RepID=A0A9W4FH71_9MYCO|nr:hypothetical protein MGALJ_24030 [Mycobacterium gallinarum]BBY94885.1 hypothetical protein MGALJ_45540 [Mycobacterium gallinarum]
MQGVADDVVLGVKDLHFAAVDSQVGEVQDAGGFLDGQPNAVHGVAAAAGGRDGDGQAVFGDVVDDGTNSPDPAVGGLELGEVGLPHPVALSRRIVKYPAAQRSPRLSIGPKALG